MKKKAHFVMLKEYGRKGRERAIFNKKIKDE